jgi:beta-aspartyl-peptidase (threonine type)
MVPALIVHGGAAADPDNRPAYRQALRAALVAGWTRLRGGGSALDAVQAAIETMEDDPLLNAGQGSALTEAGTVECDASLMEGERLAAGAVGAVSGVPNPIRLARHLLEEGRHVLLVGEGAVAFAREHGVPLCDPAALVTERQRRRLAECLAARALNSATAGGAGPPAGTTGHPAARPGIALARPAGGTVGAVAIDARGLIAAGTSTGGSVAKRPGRVGDSALIGCGTYADNRLGGVSTTGHGEAFIRTVLAKTALDILRDLDDPELACHVALDVVREDGRGDGGLILLDWRGRLGWAHSTPFMPVGWCLPTAPEPILPF